MDGHRIHLPDHRYKALAKDQLFTSPFKFLPASMQTFVYNQQPARVLFGFGTIQKLSEEITRLKLTSPLILSTPQQVQQAESLKGTLSSSIQCAGIFTEATMHTPTHITDKAIALAKQANADSVISIGGGSTTGLGKAISLYSGLPHISVPTTYAGSEMTPILGETRDNRKETKRDPRILPGTVIYDVDFTMTLPVGMSCTSGINAVAHAVEALYARDTNPILSLLALEGIRSLSHSLPLLVETPTSREARYQALYGAWLCGMCLGASEMSLHHKLCHTLGGTFNLPHAETHTIVLPHALAYNLPSLSEDVKAKLSQAFGGDPIEGLNVLLGKLGVERSLKAFGMKEGDIDVAADVAVSKPYPNPRELKREVIREVIRRAWAGEEGKADL